MMDYMDRHAEQMKHPTVVPFIDAVGGQDQAVKNAMWSFWCFAHAWDDLIDGSDWDSARKEQAFKALHDFVQDLLLNPFVVANARSMQAMLTMALTRCLDGDRMEASEDASERALAPAVRCADVDVLMHMVYLAKGWSGLREWSKLRKYDVCTEAATQADK